MNALMEEAHSVGGGSRSDGEDADLSDDKAAPGMEPSGGIGAQPRRLLVAEDEHLVAISLMDHLKTLGYEMIGPAMNGVQAIDLAKQHKPDLVVLDIRMPDMDGLSAARVLFCQMGIPVIIVSAFSEPDYVRTGAEIGVFGYLLKPVTLDDLRVNIPIAWSRFRSHSQLRGQVQELQQSLENRKIIERAKGLLMQRLGISEDTAMKRLQKQARDARRKLIDTAKAVIETDGLFREG